MLAANFFLRSIRFVLEGLPVHRTGWRWIPGRLRCTVRACCTSRVPMRLDRNIPQCFVRNFATAGGPRRGWTVFAKTPHDEGDVAYWGQQ